MGKIYLIGDSHIGLGYPNNTDKWEKVHKEYFSNFLIPFLKENVTKDDIIIHLGDLFDNRNVIPINLLNYAMNIVEEISQIAPLHIIVGNHDLWSKSSSEINTIRPFKYIPNVSIYDKTSVIKFNKLKLLMMPYIDNKKEQIDLINSNIDCHYLFCHSDLNGAKMHLSSAAHKNLDKIDVNEFSNFKKVYSGHIHIRQVNKNFTFVGSNFQMDRNDYNDQKGIFVLDTNTHTDEFFPNTISPVFKKINILSEKDVDELDLLKNSKDFIDVVISSKLLVSSRKLRRRLEILLENGKFTSVEYINDLEEKSKNEKVNESEDLTEEGEDVITLNLDYEEYIKKWILNQKWSNDVIKNGVLDEYETIIRIYKESYSSITE
jgi:DNA repair exonuclease SbcCD nuclease subunit